MFDWFARWLMRIRTRIGCRRDSEQSSSEAWHEEQTENGTIYTGLFVVWDHRKRQRITIAGCIIERSGTPTAVYLRDPPREVWDHPHGRCLQLVEPGSTWFKLHWAKPTQDFYIARGYVESLLVEALQTASHTAR